jgi:hypothetical protein
MECFMALFIYEGSIGGSIAIESDQMQKSHKLKWFPQPAKWMALKSSSIWKVGKVTREPPIDLIWPGSIPQLIRSSTVGTPKRYLRELQS